MALSQSVSNPSSSPLLVKPIELFMREAKVTEGLFGTATKFLGLEDQWNVVGVFVFSVCLTGWKEQVKSLVCRRNEKINSGGNMEKNNAFDSHLMLESYPLCSQHMEKMCRRSLWRWPHWSGWGFLAEKPAVSSTAIVLSWQNSWSNPRRLKQYEKGPRAPSCLGSGYIK